MNASITLPDPRHCLKKQLAVLSLVFFLWGCLTAINSMLIPFFYHYFALTYRESMQINVVFYIAPFIGCLPCSLFMARAGYRTTLLLALMLAMLGCGVMVCALLIYSFWMSLAGVFILATGVAAMQVVANPYVAKMGPTENAAGRLSLASAINSSGTTLAPLLLAMLLMAFPVVPSAHSEPVKWLYLFLVMVCGMIIWLVYGSRLPDFRQQSPLQLHQNCLSLWKNPTFIAGIAGIFLYVGAEVSVGTMTLSYLSAPEMAGFTLQQATSLISLYWGGALAGRFLYGLVAARTDNLKYFCFATLMASGLVVLAMIFSGPWAGMCLLLTGLMNSLMYPVIFARTIDGLGDKTSLASAFLIMAGIGGGVLPYLQGVVTDFSGIRLSFIVPATAYLLLMSGGLLVRRIASRRPTVEKQE